MSDASFLGFNNSFGGRQSQMTQAEFFESLRNSMNVKTKDAVSETTHDGDTKTKYRERLYMIQDQMTKKAMAMQIELQNEPDPKKREKILFEIKDIGRFCGALEGEIKFLRSK